MKRLSILAVLVGLIFWLPAHWPVGAQGGLVVVTSGAQVTGSGAAVRVAASGTARWIQVTACSTATCLSTNSSPVMCGGANVSTTIGTPIAPGGGMFFPTLPFDSRLSLNQSYYSLATVYCYVANGDKVNFTWAN